MFRPNYLTPLTVSVLSATLVGCGSASHNLTAVDCVQMAKSIALPNISVDKAEAVAPGFVLPGTKTAVSQSFCRVEATARPTGDSDIKFEVWMPAKEKWNKRFLAAGGGGNSGIIQYERLADGLKRGYATLSTDNGHVSKDGNVHEQSWAIGHPEKVIDFGYRAQDVTAIAGKAITRSHYGEDINKSYWIGCSQGGGKGLMQAQRFPENFDGIVAGAPVLDWTGSMFSPAWVSVKGMRDPSFLVPRSKLPMIHRAVLGACDALDGLSDGLLQEPSKCKFNPETLLCPVGTDGANCLTPNQVESMKRYWSPIVGPDGRREFAENPYGSELVSAWLGQTEPGVTSWSWLWRGPVYEDVNYDIVEKFDVNGLSDLFFARRKLRAIYDAVDPDLSRFQERGGKLIVWQGMHDQLTSSSRTIDYIDSVNKKLGKDKTAGFLRAYMAPGVNHCRGGVGPIPDEYEMLEKVVSWVERGEAPQSVLGTHRNDSGTVDRTMPICPYPQVARYVGTGSLNEASNFVCRNPS